MRTQLSNIFDYDEFLRLVSEGYIRVNKYPELDLAIANYSEKTQYDRMWAPETLNSRGLIFQMSSTEIVSRGFSKFFNFDESGQPYPPGGPFVYSQKFDGSLGILFQHPLGGFSIATRGSLSGDIAVHGSQRFNELVKEWQIETSSITNLLDREFTPLFEIIYPGNRVVVDYKGQDFLVLLDVINNHTGFSDLAEFENFEWPWKAEKKFVVDGFSHNLIDEIPVGEEGFVLYWPFSGFRCKMKSADYVNLHRIVTGMSEKTVWAMLASGKSVSQIKEPLPDELYAWIDKVVTDLYDTCMTLCDEVYETYDSVMKRVSKPVNRAEFARHALNYPAIRKYLFLILDGKNKEEIWNKVWESVKPVGDTRAFARSENDS